MKNKQNQQSGKGILRRFLAKTLALTMVLSFLTPAAPMTVYAEGQPAVELKPENIPDGKSSATAFSWKNAHGAGGEGNWAPNESGEWKQHDTSTFRFDLKGLNQGEKNYSEATIDTTYNNAGYATWIVTPKNEEEWIKQGWEEPRLPAKNYSGNQMMEGNMDQFYSLKVSPPA